MNYKDLKARVEEKVENSFTDEEHAHMTELAEKRIYNSIQSLAQKRNQTTNLTSNNRFLSLPTDWLYTHSLAVIDESGVYHYLLRKDVNFMREAYPTPTSYGRPKHYAEFNENTFILGPTPDIVYGVQMHYGKYPTSIVTAESTWVGDNLPGLLYNAVMVEAGIFLKFEEDVMALYEEQYKQSLMESKQLVDGRQEQDSYRAGFPRTQVV